MLELRNETRKVQNQTRLSKSAVKDAGRKRGGVVNRQLENNEPRVCEGRGKETMTEFENASVREERERESGMTIGGK